MLIFQYALTFFLVTNPIGNVPMLLALLKNYPFEKQRKILIREGLFALLIALFFQYCGEVFLGALNVQNYALTLCGGILLFLLALSMIFPKHQQMQSALTQQEPFFVPIATPLLAGPGVLSIIMLTAKQENDNLWVSSAILMAWVGVIAVLVTAPYLQRILGRRGLIALEQIMGLLLSMMAMEMIIKGIALFLKVL